jgi:hypothetical protein
VSLHVAGWARHPPGHADRREVGYLDHGRDDMRLGGSLPVSVVLSTGSCRFITWAEADDFMERDLLRTDTAPGTHDRLRQGRPGGACVHGVPGSPWAFRATADGLDNHSSPGSRSGPGSVFEDTGRTRNPVALSTPAAVRVLSWCLSLSRHGGHN